jgi:type I restriction enzyme S subunit
MIATNEQLPKGWKWVKLGNLIREVQSGFASGERDPNGIVQLRMNNVDTRGNITWDNYIRVPTDRETIEQYQLVKGDVVFNNTNSVELVGKSALFINHDEPVVYSNHFTRIRTKTDILLPALLSTWLNYQWQKGVFANICNRWIGQSAVKPDKLLSLDFPLPPLSEQKHIAAVLNEKLAAVEKARQAAQAQLETAKALPNAYLREVFESEEAKKWKQVKFEKTCVFKRGPFGGSLTKSCFTEDGFAVYEQTHAINDQFDNVRYFISESKFNEMKTFEVKPGDLIMSCSGTMGKVAIVPENVHPGIINQALLKLTPRQNIDKEFIKYYMASKLFQDSLYKMTYGSAIKNIASVKVLKSIEIPLPSLSEQNKTVNILNKKLKLTQQLYQTIEIHLKDINTIPTSLLRRAFQGKL